MERPDYTKIPAAQKGHFLGDISLKKHHLWVAETSAQARFVIPAEAGSNFRSKAQTPNV
jgi:hypothetical protein